MGETVQKRVTFYFPHEEVRRLDKLRGLIPRTKLGVLALQRLMDDAESGKVDLLKIGIVVGDQKKK
jgi:hypothetical protein